MNRGYQVGAVSQEDWPPSSRAHKQFNSSEPRAQRPLEAGVRGGDGFCGQSPRLGTKTSILLEAAGYITWNAFLHHASLGTKGEAADNRLWSGCF